MYPEVLNKLPAAPFWCVMFFLMLVTLGLDSQVWLDHWLHIPSSFDLCSCEIDNGNFVGFLSLAPAWTSLRIKLSSCICLLWRLRLLLPNATLKLTPARDMPTLRVIPTCQSVTLIAFCKAHATCYNMSESQIFEKSEPTGFTYLWGHCTVISMLVFGSIGSQSYYFIQRLWYYSLEV